jgi:hypothetical protein
MSDQYPTSVELHRWAETQPWGHKVSPRFISPDLIKAWNRAHPERPYVKSEAYHGTTGGYNNQGCRCDACRRAHTDRQRDVRSANKDQPE